MGTPGSTSEAGDKASSHGSGIWLEVEVQSLTPIHEVTDDVIHVTLQVLQIHVKIEILRHFVLACSISRGCQHRIPQALGEGSIRHDWRWCWVMRTSAGGGGVSEVSRASRDWELEKHPSPADRGPSAGLKREVL